MKSFKTDVLIVGGGGAADRLSDQRTRQRCNDYDGGKRPFRGARRQRGRGNFQPNR